MSGLAHRKIAILFGGPSSEREVSVGTKDFFYRLYENQDPEVVEWLENGNFLVGSHEQDTKTFLTQSKALNRIILIASHGEFVEDGYIQAKLEKYQIPFTGSNSKSCKLAMSKTSAQRKVNGIVKTVPTFKNWRGLEPPFIAKPNGKGSSIGVYLVSTLEDLKKLKTKFESDYIFQPYISGREFSLGCVRKGRGFVKLRPTEIIPKKSFFDYQSKYISKLTKEITPARIPLSLEMELIKITNAVHNALGLGFYSRSDFILNRDNELYYLETNALPGMTETSILPRQLQQSNSMKYFKRGLLRHLILG